MNIRKILKISALALLAVVILAPLLLYGYGFLLGYLISTSAF